MLIKTWALKVLDARLLHFTPTSTLSLLKKLLK